MTAWIYLFSKFTSEALLLEALGILFLLGGYSAFWILKKRRFGAIRVAEVPAPLVKAYLNHLINDAHQLRVQLFGLLSSTGALPQPDSALLKLSAASSPDPGLQSKLDALEHRMSDQMIAYEKILGEKEEIERELARMRTGSASSASGGAPGKAPSPGAPGSDELPKLKDKIAILEARLAEYSVIEDDLANLKRLQQENAQLRTQLGLGSAPRAPSAAAAPAPGLSESISPVAEPMLQAEKGRALEPGMPSEPSLGAAPDADATGRSADPELQSAALETAAAAADGAPSSIEPDFKSAALAAAEAIAASQPEAGAPPADGASESLSPLREGKADSGVGLPDLEAEKNEQEKNAEAGKAGKDSAAPAGSPTLAGAERAAGTTETPSPPTKPVPKANVEKSDEDLIAEFEKMLSS